MEHTMPARRLADATSPYLQQHADNPVDWWPWCDEALALARAEDRPILLSIGYSACHWCHVMAHESFEDAETAALMNELFVNIKVDREERPDLDRIYQTAHQLLARRAGGWPLTVFLTPDDQTPFFAGTYFPPEQRHGLPSFRDVLRQIAHAFHDQRDAIARQNDSLRSALAGLDSAGTAAAGPTDEAPIIEALAQLKSEFDATHGGFGGAPKFPHPGTLRFLLREGTRLDDPTARHLALHTLEKMANGGINDHLGGGFCRYSVDAEWMIPHFEKMLYDNGQLLALYAEAWQADDRRPLFRHVCERIAGWVMDEMQSPMGGYYASLDADSEGEEGRFYVWDRDEVAGLLDDKEYRVFAMRFGLDRAPNFEGHWHLHSYTETADIAAATRLAARDVRRLLSGARNKLLAARAQRVRPGRDEKILTSWNALMIRGMAMAGRLMQRADWVDSAERALRYLLDHHLVDGRLLASSRDGQARLNAYLDDYAYLLDALLALLQVRWDGELFDTAVALAGQLLRHFEDPADGGFFFTSDDHEALVHRPRPLADDAMPSGNAIAIEALQALAALSGDTRLQTAAERALQAARPHLARSPYAHVGLLEGLRCHLQPPEQLILRGTAEQTADWLATLDGRYVPARRMFAIPPDTAGLPPALAAKEPRTGSVLAYRCSGFECQPPVERVESLLDAS
jgi:uncharacterized protein YyaL (SSP411 family)